MIIKNWGGMKIRFSTRSRYGLRFMIELALFYDSKNLVFLREIAEKEDISEKYLTQLAIPLRARGLISSRRGAGGGYRLSRPPAQITAKEVIEALEGGISCRLPGESRSLFPSPFLRSKEDVERAPG